MTPGPPDSQRACPPPTLLVTTAEPSETVIAWARRLAGDGPVVLLDLVGAGSPRPLPDGWSRPRPARLLDKEALRAAFLAFMDAWPRRDLGGGKGFDDLFRQVGGYSVWWTRYCGSLHWHWGLFPKLRAVWLARAGLDRFAPRRVLVDTDQPDMAGALASLCERRGVELQFAEGSARPANPFAGRIRWLIRTLLVVLATPAGTALRAACARILAGRPGVLADNRRRPAVVMNGNFPLHVTGGPDGPTVWFWKDFAGQLARRRPDLRRRYLLHTAPAGGGLPAPGRFCYRLWRMLRRIPDALGIEERHPAWGAFFRSLPAQLRALGRYARVERREAFRRSLEFGGADVCGVFVPHLRAAVGTMAYWSYLVGRLAASLREAGNVAALLVSQEFYPEPGMTAIAAARRLGIPAVGIQHGVAWPAHTTYTPTAGAVADAPMPDYFAAYGEYAREVVSGSGAYPAERVWVTGPPRFDSLVNAPPGRAAARDRLRLPAGARIVLVATQLYPWWMEVTEALYAAVKDRPNVLVCIKAHALDRDLAAYRGLAERMGAGNVRFYEGDFYELLAACDVLISATSTSLLEGALLGRATISANFSEAPDLYPYAEEGGSLGARTPEELRAALAEALKAEPSPEWRQRRRAFLRRHVGPAADGAASAALAERVIRLVESSESAPRAPR